MAQSPSEGSSQLIPYLDCEDADSALALLQAAFGLEGGHRWAFAQSTENA